MTRPCSNSRFNSASISLLLVLGLYLPGLQAEVPLREFTATYELQVGSSSIGTAELSLAPYDDLWRWRLSTEASGIWAVFISKQPYSETTFSQTRDDLQLQSILITDAKDETHRETASFDWVLGQMQVSRKGKKRQRALKESVYDYQSIHLLAADMQLRQQQVRSMVFYRKGKLIDSKLAYLGDEPLEVDGKQVVARRYQQTYGASGTETNYYYAASNPLVPLLIERLENDESPRILKLLKVDWHS
jgi:hypothetical protein